ncbi:beta-ketoacyl reductase [Kibdelosporangium aridum]|uniref:beta-ketoacyl reductase n=1 Tax=Kibdelosporangium aridum TaxID=2030 RepID=UPI0035E8907A
MTIAACDAADRVAMAELLDGVQLAAVVHTAGVLDDGTVDSLTPERFDAVFRSKVDAAWVLHDLAPDVPLLLFSSVAGMFGASGQGTYAAANSALDAIAEHRHAHGAPVVSMAWGTWAEGGGMTGELTEADVDRLSRTGLPPLTVRQGLALFDAAIGSGRAVVAPVRLDLGTLAEADPVPPILRRLVRPVRRTVRTDRAEASALADRLAGSTATERRRVLVELVRGRVAAVLGYPTLAQVGADQTFTDLGFDSLTAVELRNALTASTGLRLPATLIFDYPTIDDLAAHLAEELAGTGQAGPVPTPAARHGDGRRPDCHRRHELPIPGRCRVAGGLVGSGIARRRRHHAVPGQPRLGP